MASTQRTAARAFTSFRNFFHTQAASGVLLLLAGGVALAWANSPWAASYFDLWHAKFTLGGGPFTLTMSLHHWINDGLMAVFFFVVGLEVKREMLVGELASARQAALPVAAAVGGMAVPALIYAGFNYGTPGAHGWGVPMATDIAFALGILALLGPRAPTALKVFLAAVAIADDIGAVLVIAVFYTEQIVLPALGLAAAVMVALHLLNRMRVGAAVPYLLLGAVLWLAFLQSGVHATVAGVALAAMIPARVALDPRVFVGRARSIVEEIERTIPREPVRLPPAVQVRALERLAHAANAAVTPLQRLEHGLHGVVAFAIMPLFALANAGVALGSSADAMGSVSLGIVSGLVLGKPIGVVMFSWLAITLGVAARPLGVTWRDFVGVGCLAGIGFTMSLFIAELAFGGTDLHAQAKVGVLAASVLAGALGAALLAGGRREA